MAFPTPIEDNVNTWKTLLRRLARSFKHRPPTSEEIALFMPCISTFLAVYPQLLYRFSPVTGYPPGGYGYWFIKFAHILAQGGMTYARGALHTALNNLCAGLDESRYTT
jgi:hypothetical protein